MEDIEPNDNHSLGTKMVYEWQPLYRPLCKHTDCVRANANWRHKTSKRRGKDSKDWRSFASEEEQAKVSVSRHAMIVPGCILHK